jgi:hypothetical protein
MKHVPVFVQPHRATDLLHRRTAAGFDRGSLFDAFDTGAAAPAAARTDPAAMSPGIRPRSRRDGNG